MESSAEAARGSAGTEAAHRSPALRRVEAVGERRSAGAILRDYIALTKPRIISLLLVTTVAAMFVADPDGPALATVLWTVV